MGDILQQPSLRFEQTFDALRHLVDGAAQLPQLVGSPGVDARRKIAAAKALNGLLHLPKRRGKLPGERVAKDREDDQHPPGFAWHFDRPAFTIGVANGKRRHKIILLVLRQRGCGECPITLDADERPERKERPRSARIEGVTAIFVPVAARQQTSPGTSGQSGVGACGILEPIQEPFQSGPAFRLPGSARFTQLERKAAGLRLARAKKNTGYVKGNAEGKDYGQKKPEQNFGEEASHAAALMPLLFMPPLRFPATAQTGSPSRAP